MTLQEIQAAESMNREQLIEALLERRTHVKAGVSVADRERLEELPTSVLRQELIGEIASGWPLDCVRQPRRI